MKNRQSNFELLRLVAIFMVLIVHADFLALDVPTKDIVNIKPLPSFLRFFFQALSIVCVDVFVLISGWFGIRPSSKGFLNLLFQCAFFNCGIYIVMLLLGLTTLSANGIADCLLLTDTCWFVKAYILLYILAPVINSFIENSSTNHIRNVLLLFFIFQTIFGFISDGAVFFENGYSTISFVGLYLLARYTRMIVDKLKITLPRTFFILIYGIISLIIAIIAMTSTYFTGFQFQRLFTYTNPLVIVASLSLLLYFSRLQFTSRSINWLAASAFSIYLFHSNSNIFLPYFVCTIKNIYNSFNGVYCLFWLFLFLIIVSFVAIMVDKIRIAVWKLIINNK